MSTRSKSREAGSRRETFECFGLVIHGFGWIEVQKRLNDAMRHGRQTWIVTANPEILLTAKQDPEYWEVLRQADLRLVDGTGLFFVGLFSSVRPVRMSGVELTERLMALADEKGWSVGLLGGEATDRAAWELRRRHPRLTVFAEEAGRVDKRGLGDERTEEAAHRITLRAPDILFVGFGHPKQEFWLQRNLAEMPSVKIAVGVGGTFDFWAGSVRRAPAFIRAIGFEWLWRLMVEPWRWRRIFNALIVFPYIFLKSRKKE